MNSLNLLSARVGIGARPRPQRSRSVGDAIRAHGSEEEEEQPPLKRSKSHHTVTKIEPGLERRESEEHQQQEEEEEVEVKVEPDYDSLSLESDEVTDEKQPLLEKHAASSESTLANEQYKTATSPASVLYRIVTTISGSLRWVLGRLLAPGIYLVTLFRLDDGSYSPLAPFQGSAAQRRATRRDGRRASTSQTLGVSASATWHSSERRLRKSSSGVAGDSGLLPAMSDQTSASVADSELRSQSSSDDSMPTRRSIRIKLNSEDIGRKRRTRRSTKSTSTSTPQTGDHTTQEERAAAELKSPTSPASSLGLTKYPRAPKPPRPLLPRSQPSLSSYNPSTSSSLSRKTLVLDLDETLIHSLAKGGRMSSGHMVEVRLAAPSTYNGMTLGPQHPILYYVHKRPHCDDFLRKVSQWYNLVIFTASVQEYADPVIDWLEQERKFFSARYYRQHCTFRNGAYIKDLSSIEPDLSKVMILDNSPLSYIFHESNAIPIEGWINDPTDSDLQHLIPLFEGLQYVTDVRALLALRRGELEATH